MFRVGNRNLNLDYGSLLFALVRPLQFFPPNYLLYSISPRDQWLVAVLPECLSPAPTRHSNVNNLKHHETVNIVSQVLVGH